jgi:hypothetical protein
MLFEKAELKADLVGNNKVIGQLERGRHRRDDINKRTYTSRE